MSCGRAPSAALPQQPQWGVSAQQTCYCDCEWPIMARNATCGRMPHDSASYHSTSPCSHQNLEASTQGGSPLPPGAKKNTAAGTLRSHAEDVAAVTAKLQRPAILVGHSLGGLILQQYVLEATKPGSRFAAVAGVVFVSSCGPDGTDAGRFLLKAPVMTLKVCAREHSVTAGTKRRKPRKDFRKK
jgi:hypothetical protein